MAANCEEGHKLQGQDIVTPAVTPAFPKNCVYTDQSVAQGLRTAGPPKHVGSTTGSLPHGCHLSISRWWMEHLLYREVTVASASFRE